MKKILTFLSCSVVLVLFLASSCKKGGSDPPVDQLSLLPAATQTGANTFGCLVNGRAFLPHANFSSGSPYQCNYIYLHGGYFFTLSASNDNNTDYIVNIQLFTNLLSIKEGQTVKLENYNVAGKAWGEYDLIPANIIRYSTNAVVIGQLYISKLDTIKQIVSGTFSFNSINAYVPKSDTIHVTNGRFDMKYTR